jgi:hypothetical protein
MSGRSSSTTTRRSGVIDTELVVPGGRWGVEPSRVKKYGSAVGCMLPTGKASAGSGMRIGAKPAEAGQ